MSKPREIERRFINQEQTPLTMNEGRLEGYAAVFDAWAEIRDWTGRAWQESVAPGAYKKTIQEADIRALFNHDPNIVLGRNKAGTLELREDATGLHSVIRPPDNVWGNPVMDAVRRGDITGQSIAFEVIKDELTEGGKKRRIHEARLLDISIVTYPAFVQTSVHARSEWLGMEVLAEAVQNVRLGQRGVELSAADRAVMRAAARWLEERAGVGEPIADHSPRATEPRLHSEADRARMLDLIAKYI